MWFVTRRFHESEVKGLKEQLLLAAQAYAEARQDYRDQIADLRRLVFPEKPQAVDPVVLEADAVMSGSDKPSTMSEAEHNALLEAAREADLITSGNYSEDLI